MEMKLPSEALEAMGRLTDAGYEAYAVGGCVRDMLLGFEPKDTDIATDALPEQVKAVFAGFDTIDTGLKHGTVTVVIRRVPFEITTYRVDGGYTDRRRPDSVRFSRSLREDAARRDFTMNAIAYSPGDGGRLIDYYGGAKDIEQKTIRCVGDAEKRFKEDALRILRALRFMSALGFVIGPGTDAALRRAAPLAAAVSAERIYSELVKLLCGKAAEKVLLRYGDVAGTVLPELGAFRRQSPGLWEHTARTVGRVPAEAVPRLAALFCDAGGQAAESALRRLKADNAARRGVRAVLLAAGGDIRPEPAAIKRAFCRYSPQAVISAARLKEAGASAAGADAVAYGRAAALARDILARGECWSLAQLALNGRDLKALGVPEGEETGRILRVLLGDVIDGRAGNTRDELAARAKALISGEI